MIDVIHSFFFLMKLHYLVYNYIIQYLKKLPQAALSQVSTSSKKKKKKLYMLVPISKGAYHNQRLIIVTFKEFRQKNWGCEDYNKYNQYKC